MLIDDVSRWIEEKSDNLNINISECGDIFNGGDGFKVSAVVEAATMVHLIDNFHIKFKNTKRYLEEKRSFELQKDEYNPQFDYLIDYIPLEQKSQGFSRSSRKCDVNCLICNNQCFKVEYQQREGDIWKSSGLKVSRAEFYIFIVPWVEVLFHRCKGYKMYVVPVKILKGIEKLSRVDRFHKNFESKGKDNAKRNFMMFPDIFPFGLHSKFKSFIIDDKYCVGHFDMGSNYNILMHSFTPYKLKFNLFNNIGDKNG